MRFGSVCSGIEAASVAWNPLGWRAEFVSEIDRFPCELLKVRHPGVPNFGDMTKFHEWPDATIDVLVGGTPCQSFSVAGLRGGLDDPRGNLMLTYLAIAARYRPEWLVWENVPGVLSSGGGRDFGSLLGGLAELRYGFAYRVLDAQYFNLAQRRERVFVVGCLGGWRRAAAVLFERASLQGNPAPSRKAGKNTSHELSPSIGASGRGVGAVAFNARQDPDAWEERTGPIDTDGSTQAIGFVQVSPTLRAGGNQIGGDRPPGTDVDTVETLVSQAMSVRRLTPRECERLQGFPDDYTAIKYRGKAATDGRRYKALGNSMAVPVMAWLGKRIARCSALSDEAEL